MTAMFRWVAILGSVLLLIGCGGEDDLLDPRDLLFPPDSVPEVLEDWVELALDDSIDHVQPMTGIVYWTSSSHNTSAAISLEFCYMLFNSIVQDSGQYDWEPVEEKLEAIAARGHQAIFRFRYVYPGWETSVPDYIKQLADYHETEGISEGQTTWFPDWTNAELQRFTLEFQSEFASEYDNDPRLAFIQVGFGLWGEYHIYDGPFILGQTFPSKAFQADFFQHLDTTWLQTPWSISIDAADATYSPFTTQPELLDIHFGVFDDSFMHEHHSDWNLLNWNYFDRNRYQYSPAGGEFSYYSDYDQRNVLNPETGAYGSSYEQWAQNFHITYMLGNDQPGYQTTERIKEASLASGYKFQITSFRAKADSSQVTITNNGVAPIYYDAFVAVNGMRAVENLKNLLPGDTLQVELATGGADAHLSIECDHLIPGRTIQFDGTE